MEGPMARGRKKGSPKVAGSGRKIGSPNLTTKIVREAAIMAAEIVGQDGRGKNGLVGYLVSAARKHPVPFLSLLGKCVPVEVKGTVAQEISDVKYKSVAELREALLQQGIVPSEIYGLEFHDPVTLEPLPMKSIASTTTSN
jgi:hypothetical protein